MDTPKTLTFVTKGDYPNIELGFDQVIQVVKVGKKLLDIYGSIMEDGKIGLSDVTQLPSLLSALNEAQLLFVNNKLLLTQLAGVDLDEAQELVDAIAKDFGMSSKEAKENISNIIMSLFYIYRTLVGFKVL